MVIDLEDTHLDITHVVEAAVAEEDMTITITAIEVDPNNHHHHRHHHPIQLVTREVIDLDKIYINNMVSIQDRMNYSCGWGFRS